MRIQNRMKLHSKKIQFLLLIPFVIFLYSCGDDEEGVISPKPRTYFRITFPKKEYTTYKGECPFSFDIPVYSKMDVDKDLRAEPCWLNLDFPSFQGRLHLSYKPVTGNINGYLEQTYSMTAAHQIKASGIEEQLVSKSASNVYGLIYKIGGNAASSVQFFLTDSTHHFLRGALYFNAVPNTDSIKPVVDFIEKDIQHMIETFQWNEQSRPVSSKASKSGTTVNRK